MWFLSDGSQTTPCVTARIRWQWGRADSSRCRYVRAGYDAVEQCPAVWLVEYGDPDVAIGGGLSNPT